MQPGPCSKNLLSGGQTTCRDWSPRNAKTDSCRYRCRSRSVSSLDTWSWCSCRPPVVPVRRVRVGQISDTNNCLFACNCFWMGFQQRGMMNILYMIFAESCGWWIIMTNCSNQESRWNLASTHIFHHACSIASSTIKSRGQLVDLELIGSSRVCAETDNGVPPGTRIRRKHLLLGDSFHSSGMYVRSFKFLPP